MSAEPNQFQEFSELLNNQRQSLHFSAASCSLLPLLGRSCLLLCICTIASAVGWPLIEASAPIAMALVSLHLQDTPPAALLPAAPVGEIQANALEFDVPLTPTASGNHSGTAEDCPRISSYF